MAFQDPLAEFYGDNNNDIGRIDPHTGLRETKSQLDKQKSKEDEVKRKIQASKHVILMLMNSDHGREWIYDKLNSCNVFGTPFTIDPMTTAYNSGALFVGRTIESEIRYHAPQLYFEMLKEANEREQIWNAEIANV